MSRPFSHHNAKFSLWFRQIAKGDELTISYMSPIRRRCFSTTENRRRILFQDFGFACRCEICDVSTADQSEKDDATATTGKQNEDIKSIRSAIRGKWSTRYAKCSKPYPPSSSSWKPSVHLTSPVKALFPGCSNVANLLTRPCDPYLLKQTDECNIVVPKGVIVTRIEP